jgi:adenylate cyclase
VAHLSLSMLGPFQVTLHGEPVTGFESSKVRALLAYLATEGTQHPRIVLSGLLWPDRPNPAAFANLRNALANLRTAIGDREATPPCLLITRETVQFNTASDHWLDVAAFRELVETTEGDRPAHERLAEAVALYRGDFLAGFSVRGSPEFENWAVLVRERLRRQVLDALRRLVAYHEGNGDIARASEIAWRWVELAPWEEEAHRRLMRLLVRGGQRGAALAQYEACCQVLAEELDVEPEPETTVLYERIREGDFDPVVLPPFLRTASPSDRPASSFVARERELAQLEGYLEGTLARQGRVVFVSGEAGTGKTALSGEFARRAQTGHAGLIVAGGNCNAYTGAGDPYLPFREILGQLTGDVESRWVAGLLSTEGAHRLWQLMPRAVKSLQETSPGLIDTLIAASPLVARAATAAPGGVGWRDRLERLLATGKAGRVQLGLRRADLYAQVTALLTALARAHPLLLTLDDLQWADAGTIDLLFHVGRRLAGSRILVVGIYRPSEVAMGRKGERHPLASLIHEFRRRFGSLTVHLPQAGDRQFVEAYLDSEPNRLGREFREALYQRTGGHALCTVEMLRAMQERGDLVQDVGGRWVEGRAVDWGSLPARVEGAIGERIDRLPGVLRQTLKVASVEGETFTAEVIAQVRGAKAYEIVAQLSDELDRRHRLVASEGIERDVAGDGKTSRYRFRHLLFQQYVLGGLHESERVYLHEAVGNALEHIYAGHADRVAIQLARLFAAAGLMDKAADYSQQAGDRARGLYGDAEARAHYARALQALDQLPDTEGNRQRRADALIAQASSSIMIDPLEKNLARLREAEQLAQDLHRRAGAPLDDRLRLARIHYWMGYTLYLHGEYRECIPYYQQALSVARESDNAELIAFATGGIGQAMEHQGRWGDAKEPLEQSFLLFEQLGNWSEWFWALGQHGVTLGWLGDCAGASAEVQRVRAWAQEMNAFHKFYQGNHFLAAISIQCGDLPRALDAAGRTVEAAEQAGDLFHVFVANMFRAWAASRAGQYDAAAAYAAQAQVTGQELGDPLLNSDILAAVNAAIALGLGRVQEALTLARHAVAVTQEMGSIFAEGIARRTWGRALGALVPPQWEEAEDQLAQSLRLLEEGQARLEAARTQVAWGTICRDRGELAGAREHWELAATQWEASGLAHELQRTRALIESLATE